MTENQGHNTCSPQSEVLASIQTALRNTTSEVKALKAIDENIGKINKLAEETKALLKNNKTIFENTQHSNYLHYLLLMLTESVFHFNETYFNNADFNKRNKKGCLFSLIAICNLQKNKIAKQKYEGFYNVLRLSGLLYNFVNGKPIIEKVKPIYEQIYSHNKNLFGKSHFFRQPDDFHKKYSEQTKDLHSLQSIGQVIKYSSPYIAGLRNTIFYSSELVDLSSRLALEVINTLTVLLNVKQAQYLDTSPEAIVHHNLQILQRKGTPQTEQKLQSLWFLGFNTLPSEMKLHEMLRVTNMSPNQALQNSIEEGKYVLMAIIHNIEKLDIFTWLFSLDLNEDAIYRLYKFHVEFEELCSKLEYEFPKKEREFQFKTEEQLLEECPDMFSVQRYLKDYPFCRITDLVEDKLTCLKTDYLNRLENCRTIDEVIEIETEYVWEEDISLYWLRDDKAFSVSLSDRDLLSYLNHSHFFRHKKEAFRKLSLRHKLKYLISKHIKAR